MKSLCAKMSGDRYIPPSGVVWGRRRLGLCGVGGSWRCVG